MIHENVQTLQLQLCHWIASTLMEKVMVTLLFEVLLLALQEFTFLKNLSFTVPVTVKYM